MLLRRSTATVSASRRFEFWREAVCETFVDLDPRLGEPDGQPPFSGEIMGGQIGDVRMCTVTASQHEVVRSPALIRRTGGDFLFVSLLLAGNIVCLQDGRAAELSRPGQLVLYDSAKPYRAVFRERSRQLVVRAPRELLVRRLGRLEHAATVTVVGGDGVAALASGLLRSLAGRLHDVDAHLTEPLLGNVFDVLSAAFARTAGPHAAGAAHLARARQAIRDHAGDPTLTPATLARRIGVSERYLYALFKAEGATPATAIMAERLGRARAALGQPGFTGTIEGLALRLGFKNAAHFTRAFKARYGLPPSACRARPPSSHPRA